MKPEHSSDYLAVTNPEAANLLTDWRKRRFLEPFCPGPKSLTEAAAVLEVELNALHYRVTRLQSLGLLEVKTVVSRKGRAIKLYGPTAAQFLVPFAATPHASVLELIRQLSALDDFLQHAIIALTSGTERWGVLIAAEAAAGERATGLSAQLTPLNARGEPAPGLRAPLLSADAPALWAGETKLLLRRETAKALQRELATLLARYEAQHAADGEAYFMVLGLTPVRTR